LTTATFGLGEAGIGFVDADWGRSCVVLDVTLVGEMYRYRLKTEFGTLLTLKQQQRFGSTTPGSSDPVIVEWSPQDTS
jgi:hypothetical protein